MQVLSKDMIQRESSALCEIDAIKQAGSSKYCCREVQLAFCTPLIDPNAQQSEFSLHFVFFSNLLNLG